MANIFPTLTPPGMLMNLAAHMPCATARIVDSLEEARIKQLAGVALHGQGARLGCGVSGTVVYPLSAPGILWY